MNPFAVQSDKLSAIVRGQHTKADILDMGLVIPFKEAIYRANLHDGVKGSIRIALEDVPLTARFYGHAFGKNAHILPLFAGGITNKSFSTYDADAA